MTLPTVSHSAASNTAIAGLLLTARSLLGEYGLPRPSATAILQATGAGKSRAYEVADQIRALLPELVRPPGRPASPPAQTPPSSDTEAVLREIVDYHITHPGCVTEGRRRHYSDGYRQHVVELRERYDALDAAAFADAVRVPEATLSDWLRAAAEPAPTAPPPTDPAAAEKQDNSPRIQMVLDAWTRWQGPFTAFCEHVKTELRIPYGRTFISTVLAAHGLRTARRRAGRSPDEAALRNAFLTFFPGAQWVGDGMQVPVEINGVTHTFNLELDVDAYSAALVGAAVGDEEDANAVVDALADGVRTSGAPPLSLLLDNRESNHTDTVVQALGDDTIKIRSTLGRAQNKAHVEGAFGLFAQTAPPIRLETATERELGRQALTLAVSIWGRTLNHKPRADRAGRSRVDIYREQRPTPEKIDTAKRALEEQRQRQEKAYETQRARENPIVRALLQKELPRLELDDPDGNIQRAIARYPLAAVVSAISIFEAKRDANTLPEGAAARYLLGITRNVSQEAEDRAMTEALIRLRLQVRDAAMEPLDAERRLIIERTSSVPPESVKQLVARALEAAGNLDHLFWLGAIGDVIAARPSDEQIGLFRSAAAMIRTAYRVTHERRQQAILTLAARCPALQCS